MRLKFQSEGTSQNFKQKYTIYSMTINKLPTAWYFSATLHGKGCIDELSGTTKRRVQDARGAENVRTRERGSGQLLADRGKFLSTI